MRWGPALQKRPRRNPLIRAKFGIELVVARNYALALVLITPLVLVLTGAAAGEFGSVAIAGERVVDTLLVR